MTDALIFALFTLLTGAAAYFLVISRHPSRDSGGFWAQVLDRVVVWLAVPLLILSCVHRVSFVSSWLPASTFFWLAIPALGWLGIVALGVWNAPEPEQGRWIAGTLEFSANRTWVFSLSLPFLLALFFTTPPWQDEIHGAHWGVLVMFLTALAGIALSASPTQVWAGREGEAMAENSVALSPWPDEMRRRGIPLEHITDWEASLPAEPASGAAAEWQRRLSEFSPGVSGVLCQAVARLMSWEPRKGDPVAIVLGPDDCGQEEITALLATELSRRHGETTLVITSKPDPAAAHRFTRWLERVGGESPAQLLDLSRGTDNLVNGDLLLVDAETLSESVLDKLRSALQHQGDSGDRGSGLGRIGCVVWWNAHEFSGVLAAHVWAVSRRLERLLKSSRRMPARALIFSRRPANDQTDSLAFLEHLLPFEWKNQSKNDSNAFQITSDFCRRTHLYRLGDDSSNATRRATEGSLATDWPTLPPEGMTASELKAPLAAESAAAAGARILEIRPAELLSLREMLCQGGRATPPAIEQHAALAKDDNPYCDFVLSRLAEQSDSGATLHLVSAEGHPALVQRHLLLALREVPDTLTGLREIFHWEEDMLRSMLQNLSDEGRLSRAPVRFLDKSGRLQRDARYANQNPGQGAIRSFRIVGRSHPVELRDPNVRDRLLMQVDPERLPIDAYPGRTFWNEGRRYRVLTWRSSTPSRIDCKPETDEIRTWRFATARINVLKPSGESLVFRGMDCYPARVQYHEDVTGVLERDGQGAFRTIGIAEPVRTSFETDALILQLADPFDNAALISAAAALRHILPVHAAVDEDTLEVVPLLLPRLRGLALVDLYPGGIGMVSAIHKTVWLVPMLFDRVAQWLSPLQSAPAVARLSRSRRVRLLGIDRLDVEGALRLFTAAGMRTKQGQT